MVRVPAEERRPLFWLSIDTARRRCHSNGRRSDAGRLVDIWNLPCAPTGRAGGGGVASASAAAHALLPTDARRAPTPLYGLLRAAVKVIKDPHVLKS